MKRKNLTRTAAVAQIVEAVPQVPTPDIGIQIGIDDVKSVAATRIRSTLMTARVAAKIELENAVIKQDDVKKRIEAEAKAFAHQLANADVGDLLDRLNAWVHKDSDANTRKFFFTVEYLKYDLTKISFHARIAKEGITSYSSNYFDREYELKTPPQLVNLYAEAAHAGMAVATAQARCTQINHNIANIPNMVDTVRSNLTIAKLSGKLASGDDVVRVLQSTLQNEIAGMLGADGPALLGMAG